MLISTVLHDDDYHQSSLHIHVHVHIYDASTSSVIQQAHALLVSYYFTNTASLHIYQLMTI